MIGRREDDGAGDQIFRRRGREFFLRRHAFRDRDVTGRLHELLEFLVRHRRLIHPEAVHAHAMDRLGVVRRHRHLGTAMAIRHGAHRKFAAGYPNHPFRSFAGSLVPSPSARCQSQRSSHDQQGAMKTHGVIFREFNSRLRPSASASQGGSSSFVISFGGGRQRKRKDCFLQSPVSSVSSCR